jgi:hypothetical protein
LPKSDGFVVVDGWGAVTLGALPPAELNGEDEDCWPVVDPPNNGFA